jgi:hypothetical protein
MLFFFIVFHLHIEESASAMPTQNGGIIDHNRAIAPFSDNRFMSGNYPIW